MMVSESIFKNFKLKKKYKNSYFFNLPLTVKFTRRLILYLMGSIPDDPERFPDAQEFRYYGTISSSEEKGDHVSQKLFEVKPHPILNDALQNFVNTEIPITPSGSQKYKKIIIISYY